MNVLALKGLLPQVSRSRATASTAVLMFSAERPAVAYLIFSSLVPLAYAAPPWPMLFSLASVHHRGGAEQLRLGERQQSSPSSTWSFTRQPGCREEFLTNE